MTSENCPCLSDRPYQDCCEPFHRGEQVAASAEQLMRSRYAAFVRQHIDYLLKTLHPSKRQLDDAQTLQQTFETTKWLGLSIVDQRQNDDTAEVEFIAFYEASPIGQLHERSRFSKQQGQWFYLDGEFLPPIKLARNDNCICGSGKKFKRCHG